jgi:tRNA(fMet)-specific endonuclease VapC
VILDTNGLSAFGDGDANLEAILREADELALPVIVLGEYRYGIRQSRDRARYERWLTERLVSFRILRVDEETTNFYADVRSALKRRGSPIPANDVWIAALALQHALPLVSRDRHFDGVPGIKRLAW